jgi:Cu-Zn family superoxide dismutase
MRRSTKVNVGLLVGTLVAFGAGSVVAVGGSSPSSNVIRASATIVGPTGVSGEVRFTQAPAGDNFPEPGVWVVARVEGLTPGLHGFHIHEIGRCDPPAFSTAGGHFDPGPSGNSQPDANHPFHLGDLPNLVANDAGVAHLNAETSRVTLSPGPLSIFDADGSAVVVHANRDQGIPGSPGSGVSGGPRLACGLIQTD